MNEQYEFFWRGPFSQLYPSTFVIHGETFNCAEQYMMACKATFFGDFTTRAAIMKSKNPKDQKKLGRSVSGFDKEAWEAVAEGFVYIGNEAKFTQNPDLYKYLMSKGDKILVEASPYDDIWGIGLSEEVAKVTPADQWPGTDKLGKTLTQLKSDLMEKDPTLDF